MSDVLGIYVPATPYDESKEKGQFSVFDPGTRVLEKGWQCGKEYAPLPVDLVFEKDTAVELRDGTTIYVDVFRPQGPGPFPVIIAWSPYGKSRGGIPSVSTMRHRLGIDQSRLSGLMKWEAPDPAFWCAQGYAVCNPDVRGAFNSEGDIDLWGTRSGRDGYDLVEWLAEQEWCSGKVATSGNSWLCVSQWFTAAEQPPHLAAIAPWEGFSDVYRDVVFAGGMPDPSMPDSMKKLNFTGKQQMEDGVAEVEQHPLMDDMWRTKIPTLENITVPAYVVASYTNTFHTTGTFRAWDHISSSQKWLRIHDNMEWTDFYTPSSEQDLLRFFDHFLKGEDNGWEETPTVRYSLLDVEGNNLVDLPTTEFPPPGTAYERFYLDAAGKSLTPTPPGTASTARYDAEHRRGAAEFAVTFDQETRVVGYPKVKLWVEADGSDDMDLFTFLEKLDADGKQLMVQNTGTHSPIIKVATHFGASILKYKATPGRLRVSLRRLDPELSTDRIPVQAYDTVEKLAPGQVVEIEVALYPVGLLLHPGEKLRLVLTGHNIIGAQMPAVGGGGLHPDNHGHHIIHTGGEYDSYLQLPVLTAPGA